MLLNFVSCSNLTSFTNKFRIIYRSSAKNVKHRESVFRESFHTSSNNAFKIKNTRRSHKEIDANAMRINTNVQNNVILYKNESNREFTLLRVLFFGWVFINATLVFGTYNPKYMSTWSKYKSWVDYLKANGSNTLYFAYSVTLGPVCCVLLYFLNQRFVKYIILHKGGKEISVITNHLYKRQNTLQIPINKVKTTMARDKMKNYLPLKIRDHNFYFIMDGQGKFSNARLFDYTVGAAKHW